MAGNGLQDKCTLFKVKASVVDLAGAVPGTTWTPVPTPIALDPSLVRVYKKEDQEPKEGEKGGEAEVVPAELDSEALETSESTTLPIDVALTTTESLETSKKAQRPAKAAKSDHGGGGGDGYDDDEADVEEDSYLPLAGASKAELGRGMDNTLPVEVPEGSEIPAMCIELVGSRFLRRMVRILTVSVCCLFILIHTVSGFLFVPSCCNPALLASCTCAGYGDTRGVEEPCGTKRKHPPGDMQLRRQVNLICGTVASIIY